MHVTQNCFQSLITWYMTQNVGKSQKSLPVGLVQRKQYLLVARAVMNVQN